MKRLFLLSIVGFLLLKAAEPQDKTHKNQNSTNIMLLLKQVRENLCAAEKELAALERKRITLLAMLSTQKDLLHQPKHQTTRVYLNSSH